jgi:hypothetical protein
MVEMILQSNSDLLIDQAINIVGAYLGVEGQSFRVNLL